LRAALDGLPAKEADEIVRELRGHILEREQSMGSGDPEVASILADLGAPESIAALYRTEAMISRARSTFSPWLILASTARLAGKSLVGLLVFMVGLAGYGAGVAFLLCAALKPIFPESIGLWASDHALTMGVVEAQHARELLGWWLVPVALGLCILFMAGTTFFLHWMLRYSLPRLRSLRT
jgi:uncharacterized membrane protein